MHHILYNNRDHYDALAAIVDLTGMVPAWPQPPPPMYFSPVGDELPPLSASAQPSGKSGANGFNAARPPKKGKGSKAEADSGANVLDAPEATQSDDEQDPWLMEALQEIPVAASSLHPHRIVEDLIKDRA